MSDPLLRMQNLVQTFEEALAETPGLSREERAGAVRRFADSVAVIVEHAPEEGMTKRHLLPGLVRELHALRRRWDAE